MLEDNKVYRMELCGNIKDGTWSAWAPVATERCVGVKNIGSSNFTCGPSRTLERRICSRSLGGKYCRDQTGEEVLNDEMVRTVPCQDVDCPGNTVLFMITSHSSIIKLCSEWENAGECLVEGNTVIGTRKQRLSYKNYVDVRTEVCYKEIDTGKKTNTPHYHAFRYLILIKFPWRESLYQDRRH